MKKAAGSSDPRRAPLLCERDQIQSVAAVIEEFVSFALLVQPAIRGRVAAVGSDRLGLRLVFLDFEFHVTFYRSRGGGARSGRGCVGDVASGATRAARRGSGKCIRSLLR